MQLQHINLALLIGAAGGDPWQVNNTLQSGDPVVIDGLARAFHDAGACTAESSAAFAQARQRFQAAWNRQNGEHPITDSAEVQRATDTLHLQQTQLSAIGTDLETIAAALAQAQKSAAAKINALEIQLQDIDNRIGRYQQAQLDTSELEQVAIDDTAGILHQVEKLRDDYATVLQDATSKLLSDGYDPAPLHGYDGAGQPTQNQQADQAADTYGTTRRDRDQELAGSPGEMTPEKAAAAARLRDYATVTDPAADSEAQRLAGERLDDYRMANFIGPLPMDRTMGGDARTRAQTRLELQKDLEKGMADGRAFTPNQATQLLDTAEQNARVTVARQAIEALVRNAGMSRTGATQLVGDIARGRVGHILRDVTDAAGISTSADTAALNAFADQVPTGKHWAPGVAYSAEDIAAIKNFSKHMGFAGTALGVGTGFYDVFVDHQPLVDVAATNAAGIGGGIAGAELGASVGALAGPVGAFVGAMAGGVAGSVYGVKAMENLPRAGNKLTHVLRTD
ncbi:putative alpha/beta hydrolase [Mycolicibacter senuensis]|uniref:Predicted hydrolase N-terminal domain-containing protein n=1 Tax=Mycolicibacter senuensis TaxID=386913 RepID=A0A7I9XLP4_9MYCO|nr:hypothetical protein [Mycolicibacter senuensis]ORW69336.1 hypothetical protein AWC24_06205 [Mycolicibacter senuensis]GFG70893.1 hypothetical protein MSEN_26130 [Mycolicibacter senuensis]